MKRTGDMERFFALPDIPKDIILKHMDFIDLFQLAVQSETWRIPISSKFSKLRAPLELKIRCSDVIQLEFTLRFDEFNVQNVFIKFEKPSLIFKGANQFGMSTVKLNFMKIYKMTCTSSSFKVLEKKLKTTLELIQLVSKAHYDEDLTKVLLMEIGRENGGVIRENSQVLKHLPDHMAFQNATWLTPDILKHLNGASTIFHNQPTIPHEAINAFFHNWYDGHNQNVQSLIFEIVNEDCRDFNVAQCFIGVESCYYWTPDKKLKFLMSRGDGYMGELEFKNTTLPFVLEFKLLEYDDELLVYRLY